MDIQIFKERALVSGMKEYVYTVGRILENLADRHYVTIVNQLCDRTEPLDPRYYNPHPFSTMRDDGTVMKVMMMARYMEHPKKPKEFFKLRISLMNGEHLNELALALCRCYRYRGFEVFTSSEAEADTYIEFDFRADVQYHGNRIFT